MARNPSNQNQPFIGPRLPGRENTPFIGPRLPSSISSQSRGGGGKVPFEDAAGRTAYVDQNGMVWTEGGNNPTYYSQDEWNQRQLQRWGEPGAGAGQEDPAEDSTNKLVDEISNTIIELENKLNSIPGVVLTQEEMDSFLEKAVEQVTPYYDKKREEIEKGIEEGKIRSAEDLLLDIRQIREEVSNTLQNLDIEQAETEEEFVNTLADITATKEENLEAKRFQWKDRIRQAKEGQVQTGTLTSGIGRKDIQDLLTRKEFEEGAIERQAAQQEAELETEQKFDLERISLARQSVQKQRERQLGTPQEEAETVSGALGTIGLQDISELPSASELTRRRAERNVEVYNPSALTDLEEQRKRAIESRKQTLQSEALSAKEAEEQSRRRNILSQISSKRKDLNKILG